jgi:hypothetical protein
MDITKLIQQHGPALTQILTSKAGFTAPQAQTFLPLIIGKVMEVVKGGGFDVKSLIGGTGASAIIGKLGIGDIAKKAGIDEAKATAGAQAVVPKLIESVQKSGGLESLLGGATGGAGDLMKKAGKLFGGS